MDSLLHKYDCVLINDLTLLMSIGIYDHEKSVPQNVIFNVKIYVNKQDGKTLKNIEDVVSYEGITMKIKDLCASKHFELVEELAEKIADICLQNPLVQVTEIKIEKPEIIKETKSVGVQIIRKKINLC